MGRTAQDLDVSGLDTVLLARNRHLILLFQMSMDCIWDIKKDRR